MTDGFDTRAADRWFLDRGLPAVLTPRGRFTAVWPRSAPALTAFAVLAMSQTLIYWLTGGRYIQVDSIDVTATERVVLIVFALAVPLGAIAGWRTARLNADRAQSLASAVAAVLALVCALLQRDAVLLVESCGVIVAILALTVTGVGSVLGWATRLTWTQVRAVGALLLGVLPVVLLIVLVFFNTYVWIMAATITPKRLWLLMTILVTIAVTFVVSRTIERARPTLESASASMRHRERLAGSPFELMADPPQADPLTRGERWNEVFILAATQMAQILTVALVSSGVFFVIGLVVLSPDLLDRWTHGGRPDAEFLGAVIPVPQPLLNMTLFLAALTFMYISSRVVSDPEYRATFLEPLIDDLKLTMVARSRYRHNYPASVAHE